MLRYRQTFALANNVVTTRRKLFSAANKLLENKLLVVNHDIVDVSKPLVALESTIITHGMPYPKNMEMALDVENEIKSLGAQPVTIGFLNGKLKAGLTRDEIETLAKNKSQAIKISRRDLPFVFSNLSDRPAYGGTTVSATCIAANAAGVRVFCTGGIGGVHRDYAETMDVSADLLELARTPIAVVCAGVKSILDVGKTLEQLETLGVCVVTLDPTGSSDFPAFFTRKSGFQSPFSCKSELDAASLVHSSLLTGLGSGVLIGAPVPQEYASDDVEVENAIRMALEEAKRLNIRGKKVTPFLLEKINQLTKGRSLESNLALIKNNARVSAKLAVALKSLESSFSSCPSSTVVKSEPGRKEIVTVIGGINLDACYQLTDESSLHLAGVTQPAVLSQTPGGVGRNMSEALVKLGIDRTTLVTAVGSDLAGRYLIEKSRDIGLDSSRFHRIDDPAYSSGSYCAVFGIHGDLKIAYGDMKAHQFISPDLVKNNLDIITNSEMCLIDANIPVETIKYVCDECESREIPIWYNPTDYRKCDKIVQVDRLSKLTYMSPNLKELLLIAKTLIKSDCSQTNKSQLLSICERIDENSSVDSLKPILKYLVEFVPVIILSRGEKDFVLASRIRLDLKSSSEMPRKGRRLASDRFEPHLYLFPTIKLSSHENVVNVSGAGDSASSGIVSGIVKGYSLIDSIYYGLLAAKCTLKTNKSVSDDLVNIKRSDIDRAVKENEKDVKCISLL